MDFVIRLSVFINQKGDIYNLILVIINWLTKIVHYKLLKITIDIFSLIEVILDIVI